MNIDNNKENKDNNYENKDNNNDKHKKEMKMFFDFILNFEDPNIQPHPHYGKKKYLIQLQNVYNKQKNIFEVHFEDLEEFFYKDNDADFIKNIKRNTYNYLNDFSEVLDEIEITRETEYTELESFERVLEEFRTEDKEENLGTVENLKNKKIKNLLKKKFQLVIVPGKNYKKEFCKIRSLNSSKIGSSVSIKGVVVKTSEVKPLIDIACFLCSDCGSEIYKTVNSQEFTPVTECLSQTCKTNNNKGNIITNYAISKFTNFQELKIQETNEETPIGTIPKSITIHTKGDLTKKCLPGDIISVDGILLPETKNKGFTNAYDILQHDTFIQALKITSEKKKFKDIQIDDVQKSEIYKIKNKDNYLDILINSFAPDIYGLKEIKKALILQMVGGSTITTNDGIKIRGDINISLVGDPGVAKSQLLKSISHISPRCVYTSGKGSTGAGLTAAVIKDKYTNELTLEGGALVLSDLGICCIDEFDKIDEKDRASIHEVMEQQTVSIAKAGITAQLNARSAILAASNPIYGRYNKTKSLYENINLPHSLLSRFDLTFLMLDETNEEQDELLARHITDVHKSCGVIEKDSTSKDLFKAYLAEATKYNPEISENLYEFITQKYIEKRREEMDDTHKDMYISPRSLLAIIRLAQAFAKLRFSNSVSQEDLNQAIDLIDNSQNSINQFKGNTSSKMIYKINNKNDHKKVIKNCLKDFYVKSKMEVVNFDLIRKKLIAKGISKETIFNSLEELDEIGAISFDRQKNEVILLNKN